MTGIEMIAKERDEQLTKHKLSVIRDSMVNPNKELLMGVYALLDRDGEGNFDLFPEDWDEDMCQHMLTKPYHERLAIAGALIAAEIDRLHCIELPTLKSNTRCQ